MRKSNKLSKKVVNFLNMENIIALLFAMFIIFNVSSLISWEFVLITKKKKNIMQHKAKK